MIYHGDCLDVLKTLPDNSVDSVVTDPPAGIGFMGRDWDHHKGGRDSWVSWMAEIASECLRVIKPGGHALVWAIPRTSHWTATAWENGGFEIRDRVAHVFGSGFPKSHNLDGAWKGFGTALKPAMEDWWLCRKPLTGTVAENVQRWGCGALNIDESRIPGTVPKTTQGQSSRAGEVYGADQRDQREFEPHAAGRWPSNFIHDGSDEVVGLFPNGQARFFKECSFNEGDIWPLQENSDQGVRSVESLSGLCETCTAAEAAETKTSGFKSEELQVIPGCTGNCKSFTQTRSHASADRLASIATTQTTTTHSLSSGFALHAIAENTNLESAEAVAVVGGQEKATRFLYAPKASKRDRDEGLGGFELKEAGIKNDSGRGFSETDPHAKIMRRNNHPTVKPTDLMRYLVRLVTPPGGTVLDPFAGSGSTGKACAIEGFGFIGIEREAEYCAIAEARIAFAKRHEAA